MPKFNFTCHLKNLNYWVEVELIKDGKKMVVSDINKEDYVLRVLKARFCRIEKQTQAICNGFWSIIPLYQLTGLGVNELGSYFSNPKLIDLNYLKSKTKYSGYTPEDQEIVWFWEIVEKFSTSNLKLFSYLLSEFTKYDKFCIKNPEPTARFEFNFVSSPPCLEIPIINSKNLFEANLLRMIHS